MSRSIFLVSAAAAVPLLVDASFKGAALLLLAGVCTLLMRRSSAAARHMVWLATLLALLLVPVLSVALPDWRVLPHWAVLENVTNATEGAPAALPIPFPSPNGLPPVTSGEGVSETVAPSPLVFPSIPPQPLSETSSPTLVSTLPAEVPLMATDWLFPIWAIGCTLLFVRLAAAHFLLRRNLARCQSAPDSLVSALTTAAKETGYHKPVRLLMDHERTIPVVWGIFRPSLLLPAEATAWSGEQLRSVLLHEMAHIKRRDPLVQCITQIACALHWFNPLAWIAAWRLHVERERACDDMVLTSGVRPSAYAEHLLHVATNLSAARWTNACGLAMARKSSIEGRLLAVLSDKLNRRRLTRALTAAAILLSAAIAVPIAMLRAADEKSSPPEDTQKAETVKEENKASTPGVFVIDDEALELPPPGPGARRSARLKPATEEKLAWGKEVNGLRAALVSLQPQPDLKQGTVVDLNLVVQNVSDAPVKLRGGSPLPTATLACLLPGKTEVDVLQNIVDILSSIDEFTLQPREVGVMSLMSVCIGQLDPNAKSAHDRSVGYSTGKVVGVLAGFTGSVSFGSSAEGFWKGTLPLGRLTMNPAGETRGAPKHKAARALYEIWQRHPRLSGEIPGALIGELAAAVKVFIGYNPTWETVPKLNKILPRLDATHDWKAADAIALLDEVAAVQDSPLQTAAEKMTAATILQGGALPEKFANVAWGETQPNGLRAAWVLEPGAVEHRMGTALKARLLVQNTGTIPVMARVPTWHQGGVSARDATDAEIEVSGIEWTTMARLIPVRLAPGEFIEISAPGVGLGKDAGRGPWAGPRVGSNVLAKDGTELTLTHGPIPLDGSGVGMREDAPHIIGPGWWQAHIKARLARELPLPATGAKRTHLLDRAMRELFATTPTPDEIDAFATDQTDGAFDALVQRLAARADVAKFSASLPTASVKFRVLPADPAADKTPRVVIGPGEYPLSGGTATSGAVTLKIVGRPVGDRRTNDAGLLFVDTEATGRRPLDPKKLEIPDGWGTWAIVCRPGAGFFYLLHKGSVRKIDYSNPRKVTDTPSTDLPAEFRDEVKRQLDIHEISAESQAEVFEKPAPPAESPAPRPRIRGKVLKSDGSPAVGVEVRVDDGIERWKFRAPAFPDLPRPVKTADDGTFSIDLPKGAVAENYEVFASSDDFAPLNARVPTGGDVGMMQFEKGSRVTGRVIGLDGAGLAKVGIWCKRLDWRGRGPAPMRLTGTGADGTFSIPPIATGRHVLQIITSDLGAKELAVAFANPVIEAKDDAPVELEIRPLPTVDLTLDARVTRANAEFRDFEVRVSGTLPGTKAGDPAAYWTRQETTKLAEGKHTIAVPAGLQNTSIRAGVIYMRKGDAPVFIWQRGSEAQPATTSIIELGLMDKPQTISVTVRDAQQEEMLEKPAPPATTPEPESVEVGPRADVKPDSKLLFDEDYAAFAVQSEKDVNFVLFYQGDLSSGISEWSSGAKWRFNGTVYLVDRAKTAVAGKNVNKRAISVQYTSDEPKNLYLDGKAYDLAAPMPATGAPAPQKSGRVFILRDEGEPIQTNRTLALRDEKDLVTISNYAVHDSVIAAAEIAPKAPSTATAPGRYVLGDGVLLQVRQFTEGNKQMNKATITFLSPDPKLESPHKPYEIAINCMEPPGQIKGPRYAFIWERNSGVLWLVEVRALVLGSLLYPSVEVSKFDLSNPDKIVIPQFPQATDQREWGRRLPRQFHQPVMDALGDFGKMMKVIQPEEEGSASLKLAPDALLGSWRGTVNGEKLMLSFHRPPTEKDVQFDIYFGEATIGALAVFTIAEDGSSAEVVQHSAGGGMKFGTLIPGEAGKLKLELYGRQKGQQELMLTRDPQPAMADAKLARDGNLPSGTTKAPVVPQEERWIEIKPGKKCDIGNGLFAWITSEPVGGSFRNYLTIDGSLTKSNSGQAGQKVHDSCALPYGLGTGAVTIARDPFSQEYYRIVVASASGVDGLSFSHDRFDEHHRNWHFNPDLAVPEHIMSHSGIDAPLLKWAREIIPTLKPEYGVPSGPELEVRLVASEDEPAEIVCADAPPKVDGRPVVVRFYRLGKVILTKADLKFGGGLGMDMCQAIHYKVDESAVGKFEALCREFDGRQAVVIVKEKIRGKFKLTPDLKRIIAVYSMDEFFRLFEPKPEPSKNPTERDPK